MTKRLQFSALQNLLNDPEDVLPVESLQTSIEFSSTASHAASALSSIIENRGRCRGWQEVPTANWARPDASLLPEALQWYQQLL